jgi:hypothetical protein
MLFNILIDNCVTFLYHLFSPFYLNFLKLKNSSIEIKASNDREEHEASHLIVLTY